MAVVVHAMIARKENAGACQRESRMVGCISRWSQICMLVSLVSGVSHRLQDGYLAPSVNYWYRQVRLFDLKYNAFPDNKGLLQKLVSENVLKDSRQVQNDPHGYVSRFHNFGQGVPYGMIWYRDNMVNSKKSFILVLSGQTTL